MRVLVVEDEESVSSFIKRGLEQESYQVDVAGDTAVVTFRYDMLYERSGQRYRSTGRDLWVFQKQGRGWIAVWRTMLDMEENDA